MRISNTSLVFTYWSCISYLLEERVTVHLFNGQVDSGNRLLQICQEHQPWERCIKINDYSSGYASSFHFKGFEAMQRLPDRLNIGTKLFVVQAVTSKAREGKPGGHSGGKSLQMHLGPTLHVLFDLVSPSLQTRLNQVQLFLRNHVRSWTFRQLCCWHRSLELHTGVLLWWRICHKESFIFSPSISPFLYAVEQNSRIVGSFF